MGTNKKTGHILVQIHLTPAELDFVDASAKEQVRSRKSQITYFVLKEIYGSSGPFNRDKAVDFATKGDK